MRLREFYWPTKQLDTILPLFLFVCRKPGICPIAHESEAQFIFVLDKEVDRCFSSLSKIRSICVCDALANKINKSVWIDIYFFLGTVDSQIRDK